MVKNVSLYFRIKNAWNKKLFFSRSKYNYFMSKKHKRVYRTLNYLNNVLVFISSVSACVSIPAFSSLVGVLAVIARYTIPLKICALATGIFNFNT